MKLYNSHKFETKCYIQDSKHNTNSNIFRINPFHIIIMYSSSDSESFKMQMQEDKKSASCSSHFANKSNK